MCRRRSGGLPPPRQPLVVVENLVPGSLVEDRQPPARLTERQQPPRAGLVRPKLRYAHQGGSNPPIIVIHGTALAHVPDSYRRYLERFFAQAFQIRGTPLRIQWKSGTNPYVRS